MDKKEVFALSVTGVEHRLVGALEPRLLYGVGVDLDHPKHLFRPPPVAPVSLLHNQRLRVGEHVNL